MKRPTDESLWPQCPQHGTTLVPSGNSLNCASGHGYEVPEGAPRFVDGSTYADHFGLQWAAFRRTQLDSYTGIPITRERLRRVLGEQLWNSLSGRDVLQCGCGAGRFTEILLERGARVTSIDLSDAVNANTQNCPVSDPHSVAQADIMELPFRPRSFEVVPCLGVIQHTPSPEKAIEQLYEQVATELVR
jgi:SAM-dependent methyltransferase